MRNILPSISTLRNVLASGKVRNPQSGKSQKGENIIDLKRKLKEETTFREIIEELYSVEDERAFFEILKEKMALLGYCLEAMGSCDKGRSTLTLYTSGSRDTEIPVEKGSIFSPWVEETLFISNDIFTLRNDVLSIPLSQIRKDLTLGKHPVSVMGVPLINDEVWGGFIITGENLSNADLVFLERLGKPVGSALKTLRRSLARAHEFEVVEASLNQFHLLQEINNALNFTMDLGYILRIFTKGLHDIFGYETPSVYLFSKDRNALIVKDYYIESNLAEKVSHLVGFRLKNYNIPLFEGSRLKKAIDTRIPLVTGDIPEILRDFTNSESLRKLAYPLFRLGTVKWLAALPLIAADEPVGMLVVTREDEITPKDIRNLNGFLHQASLAIKRAELHRQLEESLEQVREANLMKSQFIEIASHELRTPLTPMRLYLEMIEKGEYGEISEKLMKRVLLLQESTRRLQNIIDQTLTSSLIIKGELILTMSAVHMKDVIEDVLSQVQPLLQEKNQTVKVENDLPSIKGDKEALKKVIHVIVDNAIRYSGKNSTITIRMYDELHHVKVAISDEGIGIPLEYKEKIFDEFVIVPSEEKYARIDGRAGLGLFIAQGIVKEHGGRIWVESNGKGSTFYFTVPKTD
ncbi:MAG: hypothetical protein HXS44_03345 [Theionarchaea archaeon]|nr:hypothetical protein [Theionarchaea archaeon]